MKSLTYAVVDLLGPEVRVNAIQPGFTDETGLAENQDPELASYVTVESILVDGGWVNVGGP